MKVSGLCLIFIFCFSSNSRCQNKFENKKLELGKYNTNNDSHNNPYHYEELILYSGGKFDYFLQMNEFVQIKKNGNWNIKEDTLILNETNPKYKKLMTVYECHDKSIPAGFLKFDVLTYEHTSFRYQIFVAHIDTIINMCNLENPTLIRLQSADNFNINSNTYSYPSYDIKKTNDNLFSVKVSENPCFVKEKWLIINGKIRPKGTNGLDAGYYLEFSQ